MPSSCLAKFLSAILLIDLAASLQEEETTNNQEKAALLNSRGNFASYPSLHARDCDNGRGTVLCNLQMV